MQSHEMPFAASAKKNPDSLTVVVGCYSQVSANEVAMVQGVDYVIGNNDKMNFLDYLGNRKPVRPVVVRERIDRNDFCLGGVEQVHYEQRANLKFRMAVILCVHFVLFPFAREELVLENLMICK